jgi:RNA polymerase sigma factor (sigma-70 family)
VTIVTTVNKVWDVIKERIFNNIKIYILKNHIDDILRKFQIKIDQLVNKYKRQLPSHVASSEGDDLSTVSWIELLETFKSWNPEKGDDIWPLAYLRVTGAMKDHIRHITRTDPSRFYDWVSDAAYMFVTLKNSSSFESEIETGIELGKAMQALTERERKIIIAHTKDDLTFKRIGDMIGVSESQISRIYSKAIKTLKVELSK